MDSVFMMMTLKRVLVHCNQKVVCTSLTWCCLPQLSGWWLLHYECTNEALFKEGNLSRTNWTICFGKRRQVMNLIVKIKECFIILYLTSSCWWCLWNGSSAENYKENLRNSWRSKRGVANGSHFVLLNHWLRKPLKVLTRCTKDWWRDIMCGCVIITFIMYVFFIISPYTCTLLLLPWKKPERQKKLSQRIV